MLSITIPGGELYDSKNNEFYEVKEKSLSLEHSLVSLSKWESKWHKPFLSKEKKTNEEMLDYIRCMTLTQNVSKRDYYRLTEKEFNEIEHYINDPMTATTFREDPNKPKSSKIITAEIIYYWMISLNIPMECQKWHLNRLITLIKVCNIENGPKKKMSKKDIYARNRSLNAARKRAMHTNG